MTENTKCELPVPSQPLFQLVPRFRPDVDGLGEFALRLGDELWKQTGIPSHFIVWLKPRSGGELEVDRAEDFPHQITYVSSDTVFSGTPKGLERELERIASQNHQPIILLHFTSYAFSKEGIAWWLPGILRRFVSRGGRVACFFHELYAKGRFPNKTWFSSGLQRRIFREILALSTVAISSNEEYVQIMHRSNLRQRPVILAAIGSNVGELLAPRPISERSRRMAIFGVYTSRKWFYEQHLPLLCTLIDRLGVEEVADIGTIGDAQQVLSWAGEKMGGRLHVYGALPASEVSRLLADSMFGAVNYDASLRSKSGIIAAYQAHGVPTILFTPVGHAPTQAVTSDALTVEQALAIPSSELRLRLEQTAAAGHEYYQRVRSYAAILRQILPWIKPSIES